MPGRMLPAYEVDASFSSRGPAAMKWLLPTQPVALPGRLSHLVAVAEAGNNRISLLSTSGHFHRAIAAPMNAVAHSDRPLRYPMGVAVGEEDAETVVVADTHNHRLLRLRLIDGRPIANATAGRRHFGAPLTSLRYPKALAAHHSHEWPPYGRFPILYVPDALNHRVCAFALGPTSPSATLALPGPVSSASGGQMVPLLCFGQAGSGATDLDHPSAVAMATLRDGLHIFVADTYHDRISEWMFKRDTTTYVHVRNIAGATPGTAAPGAFRWPVGVAVLPSPSLRAEAAHLFVTESTGRRAQVLTANGSPLQVLIPPYTSPMAGRLGGVCVATLKNHDWSSESHRLVVVSREHHKLFVYRRKQSPSPFTWKPGYRVG